MSPTLQRAVSIEQRGQRKPVERARKVVNAHSVPSTMMPALRGELVQALRAGRSVVQSAKEFDTTAVVAIELWLRDVERRLSALMRPMAVTALLLVGVSAVDCWEAARGDGVEVQRGFRRGRRSRKRGLEDGNQAIEYRVTAERAA